MNTPLRFTLGAATVSVLHLADLRVRLADWLRLDEADWPAQYHELFASPLSVPVHYLHIALSGRSVLEDRLLFPHARPLIGATDWADRLHTRDAFVGKQ